MLEEELTFTVSDAYR